MSDIQAPKKNDLPKISFPGDFNRDWTTPPADLAHQGAWTQMGHRSKAARGIRRPRAL